MALQLVARLAGHDDRAWTVQWHPSGHVLASCGSDNQLKLWRAPNPADRAAWECYLNLQGPQRGTVRCVSWSPDGQRLATASFDGTACIWQRNGDDYDCVATLEGHENEVKGCGFSASGAYVATCSRDKAVWIWERYDDDEEEYECDAILNEHTQDVKTVKWHPRLDLLASASFDNTIVLYRRDLAEQTWVVSDKLTQHTSTVWCLDFNAAGDRLASGSADKTVIIWRAFEPGNPEGIQTPSSDDLKWLPVCSISGYHERPIYGLSWCPQTALLATACGDNFVRVFREVVDNAQRDRTKASFELVASIEAHTQDVNSVCWQPLERNPLLASCSDDGTICLLQLTA